MNEKFTYNQRAAATHPGHIIVSAGAGSGKTTVMIARIIDKLLKGAKLEQMLIVTFTRAAATDMRIKLSEKLAELKNNGEHLREVNEAIEALSVCNIGTLHSYCQRLIKTYFFAAEVDPAAAVLEDGEARLLLRAAAEAAVEQKLSGKDEYFYAMYDALSTRKSDDGAIDVVTDIVGFALSMPNPEEYLASEVPDEKMFPVLDGMLNAKRNKLVERIELIKKELAAAGMKKQSDAANELIDYMDGRISKVTSTSHKAQLDETDDINERFKALKKDCTKYVERRIEAESAKCVDSAPYVKALKTAARGAMKRYAESKVRLNKIDYSDLEHGAFRVLKDPSCMAEISSGIKYVFIDEFQDVNPLQSEIAATFKAAGAEMFVVGDIKQSIYGFRRCSPEHFKKAVASAVPIERVLEMEKSGTTSAGDAYIHIPLTDNFRSSSNVIDFVNEVFVRSMTEEFGGADYKNKDRLVFGNKNNGAGGAEFVLIPDDACATESDEEEESALYGQPYSVKRGAKSDKKRDGEAAFIADRVVKWIEEETEKAKANGTPPPELGSAAVLLRSVNAEFAAKLKYEFDIRGVRCNFGRKASVKSYPAAAALVDILRCIDNRMDDVALYTALRSPMGGFSDGELAEISADGEIAAQSAGVKPWRGKKLAFWQKVERYDGRHKAKLDKFNKLRDEITAVSKKSDCGDTLGYITAGIDYFQHVYETGGDARAVEALIDYASARECDIHTFLTYYDSVDFDLDIESGSDAVNITTVHSSKGLEYDLVIVADTAREFNKSDISGRVLISENGVAVKVPDKGTHELKKSVPWLIQNALAPDTLKQEELRLFYVALTRAKKQLVVCGKNRRNKFDGSVILAPEDAKRSLDFLRGTPHIAPLAPRDFAERMEDVEEIDQCIVESVKARFDQFKKTKEIENDVPIKTCVTAVAHSEFLNEGEGDYTENAVIITADDKSAARNVGKNDADASAALRGSAYHRAMELIDFSSPNKAFLESACENFHLVDFDRIVKAAAVMKELTSSCVFVARERYFIVDMPLREIYGSAAKSEQSALVQGVIDLLAADKDGNAIVVDYKTGGLDGILNNDGYKTQLRLYKTAVEKATHGKYKVVKTYLYAFEADKLVEIDV